MNIDIAQRYFTSFGWSLRQSGPAGRHTIKLHDDKGVLIGSFDSVKSAMTSWVMLIKVAYAHDQSVEIAVRLAGENADQRASIMAWARSGGVAALTHSLDLEINLRVSRIKGDNAAVLVEGKRLAPLIARAGTDLTADVYKRLCKEDRSMLQKNTAAAPALIPPLARL